MPYRSLLFLLLTATPALAADEWPQFRGPDGQGHADSAKLPLSWSPDQNLKWRTPLPGRGWSSPVISGDLIWMTAATEEGKSLRALCVDAQTGKLRHDLELFRREVPLKVNAKNSHASPTPVIEAGRVYFHFGTAGTACLDAATGEVLWRTDVLQLDHKEGPGSSPILYRDHLIVNCDGIDVQYQAALDKRTGKLAWKTDRAGKLRDFYDVKKAFSVPLVVHVAGQEELISVGADWCYGYDPATGKDLWRLKFDGYSVAPRPVAGHGLVYFSTGFDRPQIYAVRPGGRGDVTATHVAWRYSKTGPCKPSPLLVGDALYFVNDGGIAVCLDAKTGAEIWRQRLGGAFSASPLSTRDRLYFFGEDGKTTVLAPGREYKVLGQSDLKEYTMATPAVRGNTLFLRTAQALYRIEETR